MAWTAPQVANVAGAGAAVGSECDCIEIVNGPDSGSYFSYGGTGGPFLFALFSDSNCTNSVGGGDYFPSYYADTGGDVQGWCEDLCINDGDCPGSDVEFIASCGAVFVLPMLGAT